THVAAFAGIDVANGVDGLKRLRAGHVDPFPDAFVVRVEIDAAHSGGGHVRHGKGLITDGVADFDGGGVSVETEGETGTVAAEIPHCGTDDLFRLCGKPVVAGL